MRNTKSQTKLTRAQRQLNLMQSIVCVHPEKIAGKKLLLVDDVFTTGATLQLCAGLLIKAEARSIGVFTLANVEERTESNDFLLERERGQGGGG